MSELSRAHAVKPGHGVRPNNFYTVAPELQKKLTKNELLAILCKHIGTVVNVSYTDRDGKGVFTPPRVLNYVQFQGASENGLNMIALYLRGSSEPLFLYQWNQETALSEDSELAGRLSGITSLSGTAA